MGVITIPNRPAGTAARSISAILANFDAILNEFNGNIDNSNIKAAAAIAHSKLAGGSAGPFLQLLANGTLRIAYGTATMNFSGLSSGDTANIPHGLGVAPVYADFVYSYTGNLGLNAYLKSTDTTNIVFHGVASGNTTSIGGNWVAFG